MKQRRRSTKFLIGAFAAILIVYNGVQIVWSTIDTIKGLSSLVQLTYVDADENNQDATKHPFYTICPILDQMANLEDSNATLLSVMQDNSFFFALVNYLSVWNSVK